MRRATLLACVGVILTGVLGTNGAVAQQDRAKAEAKLPFCPVMGESIDFSMKTMTDDGPVYFC